MADRAVLLVDDEKAILASLRRLLRKEPYDVYVAEGGHAGLEVLAEHKIHMVVSDQRMPEMTGTDFLKEVKRLYPDTIRVVLSGYAEASSIVEAINQGEVYRFLGKPWNDEELKTTLRQCLAQYDLLDENRRLADQIQQQLGQLESLNHLLESSLEERTRSLRFSQEILECMPMMVLGISNEEEIMLVNTAARNNMPELASCQPGTDIEEILPPEAIDAVRACLTRSESEVFRLNWHNRDLQAQPSPLGDASSPRGCILLLKGAD